MILEGSYLIMTEQEFTRSKNNMISMLDSIIKRESAKLDILRSYQVQVNNTTSEEELKQLHKEIFTFISE